MSWAQTQTQTLDPRPRPHRYDCVAAQMTMDSQVQVSWVFGLPGLANTVTYEPALEAPTLDTWRTLSIK
jgi:hypothetical protein